jgi:putative acetyltransferase
MHPDLTMTRTLSVESPEWLPVLAELFGEYADLLRASHGECSVRDVEDEAAALPGEYAPPRGRLLLALHDEQPAGCAALRPLDSALCEMKRLYVRPAFRGKEIGRRLAQAIIDEACQAGYQRMRLDTLRTMTGAFALYQSLGFTAIEPYGRTPPERAVFMERTLR